VAEKLEVSGVFGVWEMYDEPNAPKRRARGLTVFGDTGGVGNQAVAIMPRLPGEPEQPPYLDAEGRREWARITRLLRDLGTLSPAYGPALGLYCQQHSFMCAAIVYLADHGLTVTTGRGETTLSPYVAIARQTTNYCQKALASFGLDPTAARKVATPPVADELEEFLKDGT
jgi:P27 family predicted phage terminase small subunit